MLQSASRTLACLALIAYIVMGMGPRGTVLCIGGGGQAGHVMITAAHAHPQGVPTACSCDGCTHHSGHSGAPCADIVLSQDESRTSATSHGLGAPLQVSGYAIAAASTAAPSLAGACRVSRFDDRCTIRHSGVATLRAVVLLV
jgi:hypothetical protein